MSYYIYNAQPRKMSGYSTKPRAIIWMQRGMLSFVTGVDLCGKYRIKGKALSHAHIMRSQICSHEKRDIFMLSKHFSLFSHVLHALGWKVCSWSHNTLPHKNAGYTQHAITNSTHTYTQHMHRTQMICTNYYHQQPSTLSMGSRREGQNGQLT